MVNKKIHIMAIGAHAGDMEIAPGPLILAHTRRGHSATIVNLTLGAKGHKTLSEEAYSKQKLSEAQAVSAALGADLRVLDYKDAELIPTEDAKMAVADLIREIRPTHVITHWPKGMHKDHIAAFQIVKDAIFYAALPSLKRAHPAHEVLGPYLSENWEDTVDYVPSIFMDVTPFFNEWLSIIRLFQLYAGGVSDYDYVSYYTNLAALRGVSLGVQYAVTLATETTLTAFITRGLDQKLSLYTSMSPIFKPQLKQNTVG